MRCIETTLVVFLLTVLGGCHIQMNPGNGQKIGRIVKLSKEGIFSKTWEGELIRGGFDDGSGSMGQSFHFTIESEALARTALSHFENQDEVVMSYRREGVTKMSRSGSPSPAFVTHIEKKTRRM